MNWSLGYNSRIAAQPLEIVAQLERGKYGIHMSLGVLAAGTIFAERYEVVRHIATGGMGEVYDVIHLETQRRRALKLMHAQFLHSEEMRNRFRFEARVAANVESENIIEVFDAGVDNTTGMPFLVMELLRGEEIGKRLKRVKRFSTFEALDYLRQTAQALDKTHRANIVHRDLKPDNLFLCERDEGSPRVKVLDFGIAKLLTEGNAQANATRSIGTPLYMAPEQFRSGAVSPATDIFALGMIAYTMLVGAAYWSEDSRDKTIFEFASIAAVGPREPATQRAARQGIELPVAFDTWFARVTALSPTNRFTSASDAVRALEDALREVGNVPSTTTKMFGSPPIENRVVPGTIPLQPVDRMKGIVVEIPNARSATRMPAVAPLNSPSGPLHSESDATQMPAVALPDSPSGPLHSESASITGASNATARRSRLLMIAVAATGGLLGLGVLFATVFSGEKIPQSTQARDITTSAGSQRVEPAPSAVPIVIVPVNQPSAISSASQDPPPSETPAIPQAKSTGPTVRPQLKPAPTSGPTAPTSAPTSKINRDKYSRD